GRRARLPIIDWRAAVALLVLFVALEGFTRCELFRMSKDFRRFSGYDARAEALARSDAFRIALVGNSATDRGVDPDVVVSTIRAESGRDVDVDLFVADRSRINTWRYMLKRYFFARGRHADLIVVTFYEDDLDDGNDVEIGRLAQFFTSPSDWPGVFRVDLPALDDRVDFVLSSAWATFAARDRVNQRVLTAVVPGYKPYMDGVNAAVFEHARRHARPATPAGPVTDEALALLLADARRSGDALCFVAYPTLTTGERSPYEVSPQALATIERGGAAYVDLRHIPEIRPEDYADEVHLNEVGRLLYSQRLAEALAPIVRSSAARVAR
ncbi:MAG TPA: hypothetical protein VE987_09350, partial [Polyangiaceae bacterium]|nr:hypothetical protein [Polyangiaceae bacterium]